MDLLVDREFRTLIPPLTDEEYSRLEESILSEGCRDALVIWKERGVILDGHNRYDICTRHGKEYHWTELPFPDREAAKEWIIQNQFGRRNLSPYQRAVLALKLEDIYREKGKMRQGTRTDLHPDIPQNSAESRDELAALANLSHDTIAKVKKIEAEATEEQKQRLIDSKATINQVFVEMRRAEVRESVRTARWPEGKYRVIYADPPWQYNNHNPDSFGEQSDHYPTMAVSAICDLPVPALVDDNAVLFLWATSPILEEAFQVIRAWGFDYKASFVWDKVKHVMGHYNSLRHEFLLIAVKGACQPDVLKLFDSVQVIERDGHSKKPALFREVIDTLYPYGPRIELFATAQSDGWESYGNQVP